MIRLPLVLVGSTLGGLAIVGLYEWFGAFVAGLVVVAVIATWFEIRMSHVAGDVEQLEETVGNALELMRKAQGRCGELPPMAYPGQPGMASCKLAHGHGSAWHEADQSSNGLPGMRWKERAQ